MKINIYFDSWEELEAFRAPKLVGKIEDGPAIVGTKEQLPETIKVAVEEVLNADTVEAIKEPEPVVDYELLRLDVRSALAELNKTHAGKPAQKLIADMGFKGLSDVPGDRLQELMDRAKEAMNA